MIHSNELNDGQYDISPLAQRILAQYYLIPFPTVLEPKQVEKDPKHFEITDARIPRCTHGAMHASRVAAYVKILHLLRQEQSDPIIDDLVELLQEDHLTLIQIIHLTQIAGLFHDVAREDEGIDYWDEESAQECANFLRAEINGLPERIIQLISNTIFFKDNKEGYLKAAVAQGLTEDQAHAAEYLRQLVHDADCLDVMRVRKKFKMQFLDIVQSPSLHEAKDELIDFVKQVRSLIRQQGDLCFDCSIMMDSNLIDEEKSNLDMSVKCDYEWAGNVYNKIIDDMNAYSYLSQIAQPLRLTDSFQSGLTHG